MKDLIILGMGPSYIQCPFDTEVWACYATIYREDVPCRRIDKLITIHSQESECATPLRWDYLQRARQRYGLELITPEPWQGVETTDYPIEDIIRHFGTFYFVDSVSYMVALAIYQGYEKIRFYGVDCRAYTYAVTERSCTEFWCGVARGRGIQLSIAGAMCSLPDESNKMLNLPMGPMYSMSKLKKAAPGAKCAVVEDER